MVVTELFGSLKCSGWYATIFLPQRAQIEGGTENTLFCFPQSRKGITCMHIVAANATDITSLYLLIHLLLSSAIQSHFLIPPHL